MTIYTAPTGKKYTREFVGVHQGGNLIHGNPANKGCGACAFNEDQDGCLVAPPCLVFPNPEKGDRAVQFNFKEVHHVW